MRKTKLKTLERSFWKNTLPLVIVPSILLFLILQYSVSKSDIKELENKLSFQTQRLIFELENPLWNIDDDRVNNILDIVIQDPDIVGISLFSDNNTLYSANGITEQRSLIELNEWMNKQQYKKNSIKIYVNTILNLIFQDQKYIRYFTNASPIFFKSDGQELFIGTLFLIFSDENITIHSRVTFRDFFLVYMLIFLAITISIFLSYHRIVSKPLMELENTIFDASKKLRVSESSNELYQNEIEHIRYMFDNLWNQQTLLSKNLSESKDYYKKLVNSLPIGLALIDMEKVFVDVNSSFSDILGYSEEDFLNFKPFDLVPLNHHGNMQEQFDFVKKTGFYGPFETELLHKSGDLISVALNGRLIKKDGSDFVLSSIENITNRKQTEIETMELQNQLNHKSKIDMLGHLAGGVAHDFNNILSGIMSAAQLITMKENLSERGQNYADMILNSAENGSRLSNKLLTFSRKNEYKIESVLIEKMIIDTINILNTMLDKNISIKFIPTGKKYQALIDFTSIQNALLNICINSSHAMPEGGEISISLEIAHFGEDECLASAYSIKPGYFIKIRIEDTGDGIPEVVINQIFDPFFTTKEKGKGTGLGLAAVKRTIMEMMGEIQVSSNPGIGTVMSLFLPMSKKIIEEQDQDYSMYMGTGTVLFVDDEEINRIMGKEILESLGYDVLLASNGKNAVEQYKKNISCISVVILDMSMPVMDGEKAFLKIKEIDKTIPVLLCSGYSMAEKVERLLDDGLDGIIPKPFRISEISQILYSCLKDKRFGKMPV